MLPAQGNDEIDLAQHGILAVDTKERDIALYAEMERAPSKTSVKSIERCGHIITIMQKM